MAFRTFQVHLHNIIGDVVEEEGWNQTFLFVKPTRQLPVNEYSTLRVRWHPFKQIDILSGNTTAKLDSANRTFGNWIRSSREYIYFFFRSFPEVELHIFRHPNVSHRTSCVSLHYSGNVRPCHIGNLM